MSNNTLSAAPSMYGAKNRRPRPAPHRATGPGGSGAQTVNAAHPSGVRRGLTGLLALGIAFAAAAGTLGTRTWQVGSELGAALFPVEDVVELAAVAVGTVVSGWVGLHALVALVCVVAGRRGARWTAGERTVAEHAPALVRRLAHAAAGAGLGLALAVPTATALPGQGAGTDPASDVDVAVVLDLGWQPTESLPTDRSTSSSPHPRPERLSLVNRGRSTGTGREPLVVVQPGDTLWAIAAGRLGTEQVGTDPSDAEIAAAVTRWHDTNRDVLGGNPDLIRPGTVLRQP